MIDITLPEQIVSHIAHHIINIGYGVLRTAEGEATEKLYQLIKARIGRDEDGRRLLQRFEQYPQSSENAAALTTKLDELARVDPQFASNLEEHARRLGITVHQGDASGTTIVSAQARRGAYANGVALSTHTRIRCDIGHYAHRVTPGHHVVGRSSMPKSKAIGRLCRGP